MNLLMRLQILGMKEFTLNRQQNPLFWLRLARQALSLLRNRERPVLVGEVSLWIGQSLRETTLILEQLVEKGLIRLADSTEVKREALQGYAYVITEPDMIPKGDYDQIPESIFGPIEPLSSV